VLDLAANQLSNGTMISFVTGNSTDFLSPSVVTVTPPSNAVEVGTNAVVTLELSERLSPLRAL
jgi:hypothetical protein